MPAPVSGTWGLVPGSIVPVIYFNGSQTIDDAFHPVSGSFTMTSGPAAGHLASVDQCGDWTGALYDERRGAWVMLYGGGHSVTQDNSVYAANVLTSLNVTGFTVA